MNELKLKVGLTPAETAGEKLTALFEAAGVPSAIAVTAIMTQYPELNGLAVAQEAELAIIPGVGPKRAQVLVVALRIGEQILRNYGLPHGQVVSSDELGNVLLKRMTGMVQEQMLIYYLNVKNEIIDESVMFKGSIESSITDQRLILRRAMMMGATRMVVAHNHPSGATTPSAQDEDVTSRLFAAGRLVGVELIDHLIIGRDDYLSFREEGLL